jgi:hypothetical protein
MSWRETFLVRFGTVELLLILDTRAVPPRALDEKTQARDSPWGTREFGFRDMDGNGLIFYRDL